MRRRPALIYYGGLSLSMFRRDTARISAAPVFGAPLRYIRLGLSSRIFPGSLSVWDRKDRGVFTERVSELRRTSEPRRRAPEGTCCYLLCAHGTRLLLPVALSLRLLLSLGVIPPYALRKPFSAKILPRWSAEQQTKKRGSRAAPLTGNPHERTATRARRGRGQGGRSPPSPGTGR